MAIDNKYGRITLEHGDIGEDEPVVVFRAQDQLLPKLLAYYHLFCLRVGSPRKHLDLILDSRDQIEDWQTRNITQIPRSDSYIRRDNG